MLRFTVLVAACVIVITLPACHHVVVAPGPSESVKSGGNGPPPHAPAHGYRRKHQSGAELLFDSRLGVYVVVGRTELYFHDGWFIRIRSGIWEVSAALDGPWETRDATWVPSGLRSKHHAKKKKTRGRGAAKIAW